MLDNFNIKIEEVDTTYFDGYDGKYCVDAWWTEKSDKDNKQYSLDYPNERGTTIGTISEDGVIFEWSNSSFRDAIYDENNDNLWVLDEIEDAQRRIKEEYISDNNNNN